MPTGPRPGACALSGRLGLVDEGASFEPRSVLARRRAGWTRLAIVVPVVALIGAVWIGTSGPRPGSSIDAQNNRASAQAGVAAVSEGPPPVARHEAAYPSRVLGIEVRTLADVHPPTGHGDAVVAVAGWYVAWPSLGCPTRPGIDNPGLVAELGVDADIRTFCDRSGVLFSTPNPAGSTNVGGANDHPYGTGAAPALPVVLTPGVVVPPPIAAPDATPVQVIVVGRVVQPRGQTSQATTALQLVVDRVAWTAGIGWAQTTSILPKLLDQGPNLASPPRDRLTDAMIGPTGAILMETLVDPATLAYVDPQAAALIADTSPKSKRIWYRLALSRQPDRMAPRWIAIDDTSGAVIGDGILGNRSVIVVGGVAEPSNPPEPRLPLEGTNTLAGG